MRVVVAALQMSARLLAVEENLERADHLLREAHLGGARLAVLPEMFNTGYGFLPDYAPYAECVEGRTLTHLRRRSQRWGMTIAAGLVERDGRHLYDSVALCQPDGSVRIYRKRHLVFWERFRFRPGRSPLVVPTPFGNLGLAICADMIYRRIWDDYRRRIDLAVVSAAWPDFANRHTGRRHWLMGHVGPMSAEIPAKVAGDLGIPVVFANQSGPTHTTIPLFGMLIAEHLPDRFAGRSSICDGHESAPVRAGVDEEVLLSTVRVPRPQGAKTCVSMSPSGRAA